MVLRTARPTNRNDRYSYISFLPVSKPRFDITSSSSSTIYYYFLFSFSISETSVTTRKGPESETGFKGLPFIPTSKPSPWCQISLPRDKFGNKSYHHTTRYYRPLGFALLLRRQNERSTPNAKETPHRPPSF